MIFGEDFGQLAASGEYEVYKSGTTLAQLNAAIASLSDEEYLDSFLVVVTDAVNVELIHSPERIGTTRRYKLINAQTTGGILYTQYWQSNVLYYRGKNVSSGSLDVDARATNETGANLLTLNSWTLYKRQKGYDVANGGSNVAYAIAPVQNTLSAANKNYAVGEQFLYDGHLYKVTSAITSGAQIVIGTNAVAAGTITEQIGDLNDVESVSLNSWKCAGVTEAYGTLKKYGKQITIQFAWYGSITGTSNPFINVPQKYRPSQNFSGIHTYKGNNGFAAGISLIKQNGDIVDQSTGQAKTEGNIDITYWLS